MNRRKLYQIVALAIALYLVLWVGVGSWLARDAARNDWLVDREADPDASPIPNVSDNDWVAVLAEPSFASKSRQDRVFIANNQFEKIRDVARGQGFDLDKLQAWYQQTAIDAERYPIKKFVFSQHVEKYYRDLRDSRFPKPDRWRVFWSLLFTKEIMLAALVGLPVVAALALLLVGLGIAIFSRTLTLKWRFLIVVLLAIIVIEGWLIRTTQKQPVSLGLYSFYDSGDYLSIEGTWVSDAKLGFPIQVSKLDCWREWNHCIEANAKVYEGQLLIGTSYWEVKNWGPDEISFKADDSSLCSIETLHIHRKSQLVTATHAAKLPKSDSCKGGDEPVVSHLVDGYKLRYR